MIKATLTFEENEIGLVDVEIAAPLSNGTETDRETFMLVTFMAFNNCLSQEQYLKLLGAILGEEIDKILKGQE
jgi:hypothetical protein